MARTEGYQDIYSTGCSLQITPGDPMEQHILTATFSEFYELFLPLSTFIPLLVQVNPAYSLVNNPFIKFYPVAPFEWATFPARCVNKAEGDRLLFDRGTCYNEPFLKILKAL